MRQIPKQEWVYRLSPLTFFPSSFFSDCFLHLPRLSVSTGSMRGYLEPKEVGQVGRMADQYKLLL